MFDHDALKARIIEVFGNYRTFARDERLKKAKGLGEQSVYKKLQEKVSWTDEQIFVAMEALELPMSEVVRYFFTPKQK